MILNFFAMFQNIHQLSDRLYKATIGVSKKDFQQLAVVFSKCEQEIKNQYYEEYEAFYDRKPSAGGSPFFKTPSEKLFLVLFYLKTYPSFDVLGFTFGCSRNAAHENVYKFLPILESTLDCLDVLPKREFESVEEFIEFTRIHKDILADATERVHHRKKEQEEQKKYYNGKKKAHTVKNTVISTVSQMILFLGYTVLGSTHDFSLFKKEFPPALDWFKEISVWIDLGYLGFAKNYKVKYLQIPIKKPYKTNKNPDPQLTPEQKAYNREVSKTRVKVENAIGGIKRYNILVQKFRNKSEKLRDQAIFLAAGIWNFSKGFSFS